MQFTTEAYNYGNEKIESTNNTSPEYKPHIQFQRKAKNKIWSQMLQQNFLRSFLVKTSI